MELKNTGLTVDPVIRKNEHYLENTNNKRHQAI